MTEQSKPATRFIEDLVYEALKIIQADEGIKAKGQLMNALRDRGFTDTDDFPPRLKEKNKYGNIEWRARFGPVAQRLVDAGFLLKGGIKNGWKLTSEGDIALEDSVGGKQLFEAAREKCHKQGGDTSIMLTEESDADDPKERAMDKIVEDVRRLSHRDFEKLCAALLRGMGYYVPYTARPGPDGGIDIIAYTDPLGAARIKVQVKHHSNNVTVQAMRELAGLLKEEGDIGVLISSSDFTKNCKEEARSSPGA